MKKMILWAALVLPMVCFGQQPLKNKYGKFVEVNRNFVKNKMTIVVSDSVDNYEQIKDDDGKDWQGSVPEIFVYMETQGYEFQVFVPESSFWEQGLLKVLERAIFKKRE